MFKKLSLLLSVLFVATILVACGGGNSEIDNYLSDNEDTLVSIFGNMGLGDDFEMTTSGDNQLVVNFEVTEASYETMSGMAMFDDAGSAFEAFINDVSASHMYNLATAITNETDLDSATIRIIINFDGEELTTLTFNSQ